MYDYAKPSRVFTKVGTNMSLQSDSSYSTLYNFEEDDIGYLSASIQPNNVATGFLLYP